MDNVIQVDKRLMILINQLAELEQKIERLNEPEPLRRHMARMKDTLAEMNLAYDIPLGQSFSETRTDVEAHIAGADTEDLAIIQVIKPIIRFEISGTSRVIQKGVVVVQGRKETSRG